MSLVSCQGGGSQLASRLTAWKYTSSSRLVPGGRCVITIASAVELSRQAVLLLGRLGLLCRSIEDSTREGQSGSSASLDREHSMGGFYARRSFSWMVKRHLPLPRKIGARPGGC